MTPIPVGDLNPVDAWSPQPILRAGDHPIVVIDADDSEASSGGHPQITLKMEATDGDEAGGVITDWIVVTEHSLGRVKQMLEAFGADIPAGAFELDAKTIIGHKCKVLVRDEPKRDGSGDRSVVKGYVPLDGDAPTSQQSLPQSNSGGKKDVPFRRPEYPAVFVERGRCSNRP